MKSVIFLKKVLNNQSIIQILHPGIPGIPGCIPGYVPGDPGYVPGIPGCQKSNQKNQKKSPGHPRVHFFCTRVPRVQSPGTHPGSPGAKKKNLKSRGFLNHVPGDLYPGIPGDVPGDSKNIPGYDPGTRGYPGKNPRVSIPGFFHLRS